MFYYCVNEWSQGDRLGVLEVSRAHPVLAFLRPCGRFHGPRNVWGSTFEYREDVPLGNKLYVGNIAYEVDTDALNQAFGQYGTVTDCTIIMDRETGRSKGFGFVQMSSDSEAQAALDAMDGAVLEGRPIRVSEARPREERGPRGPRRY